ncbi:hypothetical protein XENORESO_006544 [Xenotaenia resolanae]|uniref:Uncharacterized protein n=1 Tax=Xenotaenia resolanae TaxID=208358 RepID=A0ABV0VY12_9TELE
MLFNAFHSDSEYIGTYLTCIWGSLWTDGQSKGQPRDMQDKQPCTHTHTSGQLRETNKPNSRVFDSTRKPEHPDRTHACYLENMQTPCRKTPGGDLNPGPSCCQR